MIIVNLKSAGLGNCLFQYAAGKALSIKHNTQLKFDISSMDKNQMPYNPLSYEEKLNHLNDSILAFNIDFNIAKEKDILKLRSVVDERAITNKYIRKIVRKIIPKRPEYYKEKTIHSYDPLLSKKGDSIYLDGTFINPKYFKNIRKELLSAFTLKKDISPSIKPIYNKLCNTESVSIHIRRGDYINQIETKSIYPVYGRDYIKKAINLIETRGKSLTYFVFSDDIDWCKDNLIIGENTNYISGNKPYEELYLMKSCKNNIITNSTFSWWAAWLNQNHKKTIISPKKWRNDSIDTSGMLFRDWIIIE